ncbi:hypothetical protein LJC49_05240 [Ruminococcaceae bacterium OttesenSCG-928-I18]|nr:hypothetical protein [Ruminococcaceae bacterium OttesenSCG-928-I18]
MDSRTTEQDALQTNISHYSLDFLQKGEQHFYVWRNHAGNGSVQQASALLIDLNHVYIPNQEIEKLLYSFECPKSHTLFIAIAHCHIQNQQEIKRKLKAINLKLFSQTAFFTDLLQAEQWLAAQSGH